MKNDPLITIISGEHSGDVYAADLIKQMRQTHPKSSFNGISGTLAQSQGLKNWAACQPMRIMGFTQVFKHRKHYRQILKEIESNLCNQPPDLLILIDYAGLNLRIAKIAHALGLTTLYYIPPKTWAWGASRLKKIKKYVSCVAPLYPFENTYFSHHSIPSKLVRHPYINQLPALTPIANNNTIALLPGSRRQEVNALLPTMLKACYLLTQTSAHIQFKLFCAEKNLASIIDAHLLSWQNILPIEVITQDQPLHLQSCYCAIVCSGTATFECAMLRVPMVVIYRCNWINYLLIKLLVRTQWASLPNIILQTDAVVELLQGRVNPELIFHHTLPLLSDSPIRRCQLTALETIYRDITNNTESLKIGNVVEQMLQ